jgi:hypothetical protein
MQKESQVCVFSHRNVIQWIASSSCYEFEDLIASNTGADLVVADRDASYRKINSFLHQVTKSTLVAKTLTPPDPKPIRLERDYDIFVAVLPTEVQAYNLRAISNLHQKCRQSVCYIYESWETRIFKYASLLEPLKSFDRIFSGCANTVEALSEITGRPCTYLSFGVDALKFCPYPTITDRCIDLSVLGRRSPITHQAAREAALQSKLFYYYDSLAASTTINPADHRLLYANILKRSKYFVCNRANINETDKTGGKTEIGHRYFEGAAAGAILIGEHPQTERFAELFDWPDAAIWMPFDAPDTVERLRQLEAQPDRIARIRRDSVVNSLLRHDWVYRWQTILDSLDLDLGPVMIERQSNLASLAEGATSDGVV